MTSYTYKATNYKGDIVSGTFDAGSEDLVIDHIQSQNLIPIKVTKKSSFDLFTRGKKVSKKMVTGFTVQLSTLLGAGMPLDRSLFILTDMEESPEWRLVLDKLLEKVKAGGSLSDAMRDHEKIFSKFYVNLIHAGEISGSLSIVLERLSEYQEKADEMRSSILKALIYPIILVVVGFFIFLYLLLVTVPQFVPIVAKNKANLPFISDVVFGISAVLQNYWYIVFTVFFILILYLKNWFTNPKNKTNRDKRMLKIKKISDIVRKSELARASRTLGTMLTHGVPLVVALNSVRQTVNNSILGEAFESAMESLKAGRGMSKVLIDSKQFPPLGVQMIKVGEETGKLEEMLVKVANIYEKEVKNSIDTLVALITPAATLLIAVVVVFIMVGVILAILSLGG